MTFESMSLPHTKIIMDKLTRTNKMKKTLIALSVSAAAMATGVNAAELYNQDGTSLEMGGRAEARLSMKTAMLKTTLASV